MRINHSPIHPLTHSSITGPLLFLVALIARLGSIGRYVTPDELAWVHRSVNMRQALLSADWAHTIQAGHPGVITSWLGAIGVQLTLWLNPASAADVDFIRKLVWINPISGEAHQHLAPFLTGGRIMIVLASSTGIWLIYRLLAKRFGTTSAITAAIFLALDPWVAGLSSLLHVDALLATFILIALLLTLQNKELSKRDLLLAGLFTSLATLNKLPGAILLGMIPLILFVNNFAKGLSRAGWTATVKQIGWWLAGLIVTSLVLLPALWADPQAIYDIVLADSTRITSKRAPIFFMGAAEFDIGLHFYPLAVLIRQSPLVTLGLGAGGWLLAKRLFSQQKLNRQTLIFLAALLLFCLLFWAGITVSSREFVRYALPISFALILLAGLALGKLLTYDSSLKTWPLLLVLQIFWMAWFWRYPLSAANLLTGGPGASVKQVALGWGDGVSRAAKFASEQPNAINRRLFTTNVPAAAPFYPGDVYLLEDQTVNLIRPDDFVLIPLGVKQVDPDRWQTDPYKPLAEQFPAELKPIHAVQFNRLERAWLYSNFPAELLHANQNITNTTTVRFGDRLFLNNATLTVPENKFRLVTQLEWQVSQGAEYQLALTIEDGAGNTWLRWEESLVGISGLSSKQWDSKQAETIFQKLTYPADMPPADYLLKVEVFDANGNRLGVFGEDGQFQGTSATVGRFRSPLPNKQSTVTVENGGILNPPFQGFSTPPAEVGQGENIRLDLWWQHPNDDHSGDVILLEIDDMILPFPVGMVDWRGGDRYRIKPEWIIPVDFPAGQYSLAIGRASDESQAFQPLGQITIEERDRSFSLPADIDPLILQFGTAVILQDLDVSVSDQVTLNLVWQGNRPDGLELTMFVHLKDVNGEIIDQLDRPLTKPTHLWLDNEVVLDSVTLPLPDTSVHEIAIGLYDPSNGQRLVIRTLEGEILPDGQYLVQLPAN